MRPTILNSMAVSVTSITSVMNLTRSLEKILDECSVSGELVLANRKLKDFNLKYYKKHNLTDTVFAGMLKCLFHYRKKKEGI